MGCLAKPMVDNGRAVKKPNGFNRKDWAVGILLVFAWLSLGTATLMWADNADTNEANKPAVLNTPQASTPSLSSAKEHSAEETSAMTPQESYFIPTSLIKGRISNQSGRYILGPGDSVGIQVRDLEKFDQKFTIQPDGYASIHPFGQLLISGMDLQGLENWLEERLTYYLLKPEVTVKVDIMRPALIKLSGAVARPGTYQFLREGLNNSLVGSPIQEKVEITLSNVLSHAGGLTNKADIDHIQVIRDATGEKLTFNLRAFISGQSTEDIWLIPGDTVVVPELPQAMDLDTFAMVSRSTFYKTEFPVVVLGAVEQQGEVKVSVHNNTLNAALGLAGGFKPMAKEDKIIVQRQTTNGGYNRIMIARDEVNFPLQPGDIVYVSNRKLAKVETGLRLMNMLTQPYFMGLSGTRALNDLLDQNR